MTIITRTIHNTTLNQITLFVPGYDDSKPPVIIPASTTVDLFTVVTGDQLEAIQPLLNEFIAAGEFTVIATVDTATFNPVGNSSPALTFSAPLVLTGTNVAYNGGIGTDKFFLDNPIDASKQLHFDLSGESTSVTTTFAPLLTANTTINIRPLVDVIGNIIVQNNTSGQIFIGADATIGGANSGIQYSNSTVANRAQLKLHSYFAGNSIAGVSTLTSRSGAIGTNTAVVAGQDYSKWTAQAAATTPGSAPISGTFVFKSNSVNSLTVPSDYYIQLTNLAGTLGTRLYLTSEGQLGLGTTSPNSSSLLDVTSTTRGFLPPRMTTVQRDAISTPAEGLMIYNTDDHLPYVYNGTAWTAF